MCFLMRRTIFEALGSSSCELLTDDREERSVTRYGIKAAEAAGHGASPSSGMLRLPGRISFAVLKALDQRALLNKMQDLPVNGQRPTRPWRARFSLGPVVAACASYRQRTSSPGPADGSQSLCGSPVRWVQRVWILDRWPMSFCHQGLLGPRRCSAQECCTRSHAPQTNPTVRADSPIGKQADLSCSRGFLLIEHRLIGPRQQLRLTGCLNALKHPSKPGLTLFILQV